MHDFPEDSVTVCVPFQTLPPAAHLCCRAAASRGSASLGPSAHIKGGRGDGNASTMHAGALQIHVCYINALAPPPRLPTCVVMQRPAEEA